MPQDFNRLKIHSSIKNRVKAKKRYHGTGPSYKITPTTIRSRKVQRKTMSKYGARSGWERLYLNLYKKINLLELLI